jgi:hypothetical protein
MSDTLKANFLKRVDSWPTKEVECRGVTLTIQALNRDEAMRLGQLSDLADREAQMLSLSIVEPFTLTPEEAQQLRIASEPLDLEALTGEIARLSGMDKKSKEAQNAAFKSVRDESGTGVRAPADA